MSLNEITSDDFSASIVKAIRIIVEMNSAVTDSQMAKMLQNEGIGHTDAVKFTIFLPIAFCRLMLPNVNWKDQYYEINAPDEKPVARMFSHSSVYLVVMEEVRRFFSTKPSSELILKIAGRSSEFKVINELLLSGQKLEDLKLTPMCIVW